MVMLKLSKRDIRQGYKGVKHLAQESFAKGDLNQAFLHVKQCATLAQQFNWIYCDDELEDLLAEIGKAIIPEDIPDYTPNQNRVVLYDDFCTSYVLALQYLDALVEMGKEVLYITSRDINGNSKFSHILETVQTRPNVRTHVVPLGTVFERNIDVYQSIVGFCPSKVLLHIKASSIALPVLYRLPKQITRYIINLADQTFWLGKKAVDYVLEFRQFGVSVSQQRRGIKPEQQLLVPFYPVVDGNEFQGFPKGMKTDSKVVVFSGGDLYKVTDKQKMFWHLVKRLLDSFPEVVFWFATKAEANNIDVVDEFIKSNNYSGRFFYTPFRADINEVFAHIDVFMGTCPVCGSLMSQLAARNAVPILQYYYPGTPDDESEQAICVNDYFRISYQDEEQFMQEAEKIIRDDNYRKRKGSRLMKAMVSVSQFNELVQEALESNQSPIALKPFSFDYKQLDDRWFELEQVGSVDTMPFVYGILGDVNVIRYAPSIFVKKQFNKMLGFLKK